VLGALGPRASLALANSLPALRLLLANLASTGRAPRHARACFLGHMDDLVALLLERSVVGHTNYLQGRGYGEGRNGATCIGGTPPCLSPFTSLSAAAPA